MLRKIFIKIDFQIGLWKDCSILSCQRRISTYFESEGELKQTFEDS